MNVLFVHQAFPAQFGRLALELARRSGWACRCLVRHLSACPTPSRDMLDRLTIIQVPAVPETTPAKWTETFSRHVALADLTAQVGRNRAGEFRPDLVVGHCGIGPFAFLPEVYDCPFVGYCEYYLAVRGRDLTYRADLPPTEPAPFYPRCINAATLTSLQACRSGYSPTAWQRDSFPARFRPRIEVHFDGVETELYRPRVVTPEDLTSALGGLSIRPGTKVVTFVARGLESMRGFDLFVKLAERIGRERSDVAFVVVGGDESYYGWDSFFAGKAGFKQWVLSRGDYDLSRFLFLGQIDPERLAVLLARSDLHVYLSVPFVTSWSVFDALSAGCVVLAADIEPVRELIEPGVNGLVEPLFDLDRLTAAALRVLADPAGHRPLGQAARARSLERYSLDVCVPALKAYFEREASAPHPPAPLSEAARGEINLAPRPPLL